jgi:predicted RNA-binding Zn-ribbon protein involved in translation (DUF1610 family)
MKLQSPDSPDRLPSVHLFCPKCGESASIRSVMPMMFAPTVDEITHRCDSCGTETRIQIKAR